jgi:hypothetical protein
MLSFPDFRLPASVRKCCPISFLRMCYHPESGVSVVSCSGIASFTGFGGRSALLILVRVALLLPSDDEPFSAFTLPGPGKQAAVAEASDSPLRRQAQPSKEHLAVAGVGRFPSVLPSGFRLRSFRQSGFHLSGQNIFPLKVRALPPDFSLIAAFSSPTTTASFEATIARSKLPACHVGTTLNLFEARSAGCSTSLPLPVRSDSLLPTRYFVSIQRFRCFPGFRSPFGCFVPSGSKRSAS